MKATGSGLIHFSAVAHIAIDDNFSWCILPVSLELLDWIVLWMDSWIKIPLEIFQNLNHIARTNTHSIICMLKCSERLWM